MIETTGLILSSGRVWEELRSHRIGTDINGKLHSGGSQWVEKQQRFRLYKRQPANSGCHAIPRKTLCPLPRGCCHRFANWGNVYRRRRNVKQHATSSFNSSKLQCQNCTRTNKTNPPHPLTRTRQCLIAENSYQCAPLSHTFSSLLVGTYCAPTRSAAAATEWQDP